MIYGWRIEPALFGPGPITIAFDDPVTGEPLEYPAETLERPTTVTEAVKTFKLVVIGMRLNPAITVDWPHPYRPRYAYLAQASKGTGVRSVLNDDVQTITASRLKVLKERLRLVKDPEWIQVQLCFPEDYEELERQIEAVPILNFSGAAEAARSPQMQVAQSA
ncbi:hypothetical protein C8R47DRAFT_1132883 [Mycena vitilis]|nr:hypothetical protein C8R47DRAFT_1132883 [Mycena vitilis]